MKRHYTQLLEEYLTLFPCVAIIGVRQCGKTSLIHQLPSKWNHFDLEKIQDRDLIQANPDLFLRLNPENITIDESQLLPEIFPALRVAIDERRDKCGRFIITGSSSPELIQSISESLAGRIAIIEMEPFNLAEACEKPVSPIYQLIKEQDLVSQLNKLKPIHSLNEVMRHWLEGGYPEQWIKNSKRFRNLWMQNYIQTYLDRDILRSFPKLNRDKYRLFIQLLSQLSSQIINYSNLSRLLGVSQPTARDYFNIAQGTFIWRHLPAYEKNATKRIIKHPKGYLRDTGLLHHMLHIRDQNMLLTHPMMGHSWEAMVAENIIRGLNTLGVQFKYYHYRTGAGAEVDLILEGEFGLLPIEIKFAQNINNKSLRSLRDFVQGYSCKYGLIIHNHESVQRYDANILGIPATCL